MRANRPTLILECEDYKSNANQSLPKNKANREYQGTFSSTSNGLDIMLGFHIPENQGQLQCLSLVDYFKITDDALKRVLDSNPKLTKLCLSGCTRITAEGIVTMVKGHTEQSGDSMPGVKILRIRGLYGLTKDHLDNLKASLDGGLQEQSELVKPQFFFYNGHYMFSYHDDRSINVEVYPNCENAKFQV